MTQLFVQKLIYDISQNIFPEFKLEIISNEESKNYKKSNPIFDKTYKCLFVRTNNNISFQDNFINVTILLVHPTLYELQKNNAYNKILSNITGYDAILNYEQYLKETYGDHFYSNHISPNLNKNNYLYEQILTRANNDLNIPTYFINTYKPNHNFTYYFYDDFYLLSDKEITLHYLNINNKDLLKRVDVSTHADTGLFLMLLDKKHLSDQFAKSDKSCESIILNNSELFCTPIKEENVTQSEKVLYKDNQNAADIQITNNRSQKFVENSIFSKKEYNYTRSQSTVYVPDNNDNATLRLNIFKDFMKNGITEIINFEIHKTMPDFPNFGMLYNLEEDARGEYIYTPFTICNIFSRNNIRERNLYHSVKTMMFKYKNF
jgi:hypothetical protein